MKDINLQFAERIKYLRSQKWRSQEELWYKTKLHRTYIGMIERQERNITLGSVHKLAKAFGITVEELFKWFKC